ncbi:MAG TPA: precorrin-8X methylmutase [Acidimicrobiales bacterium]|nr:precorrin-8X methylmutase [Acidimicrobiales bacterium]
MSTSEHDRAEPGVHPIEAESFAIMAGLVDLGAWPEPERQVVARMIHATADESFAASARIGSDAVAAGVAALRRGATVVCDARMVVAGMPAVGRDTEVVCYLDRAPAAQHGRATRSEAAIEQAAADHPEGAVWVVGNAPTALARLLDLHQQGGVRPALVVGLPVGYVGAAEAKEALWDSTLRAISITNKGRRGGSPVAAAAVNALLRLSGARQVSPPR